MGRSAHDRGMDADGRAGWRLDAGDRRSVLAARMVVVAAVVLALTLAYPPVRTAYLSALGFSIVLLNFVPVSYFLTESHDF